MPFTTSPTFIRTLAAGVATLVLSGGALAQSLATPTDVVLTPEEIAEKDGRKACKVAICKAFHTDGAGDVSCRVTKSWRATQLDKLANKAAVSWPWGAVKCDTDISLSAPALRKAVAEPKSELELSEHKVTCTVARDPEPAAQILFSFKPKVTFEGGKAKKAALNWGKIEAPTLVKGAMWTATATDNTFNVLQSTVVEDINDFIGTKCDEVKADWSK